MRYEVKASREVTQTAIISVEANTEDEAILVALAVATTGPANWEVAGIEYTDYEVMKDKQIP